MTTANRYFQHLLMTQFLMIFSTIHYNYSHANLFASLQIKAVTLEQVVAMHCQLWLYLRWSLMSSFVLEEHLEGAGCA